MGRNNKSFHKDLKQQIYESLTFMLKNGTGRSKADDKKNGSIKCILTRKYKSNAKTGLWEVTLYTTFEPTIDANHRKNYV